MTGKKRIIIIGAGPAGLSLAYYLLHGKGKNVSITIVEKEGYAGGIASGFEYRGLIFDYGSHRLHPATGENLLDDIRSLLGDDLLDRPRDGRVRLLGRYVKFPLKLFNFMLHLPITFFLGILADVLSKPFRKKKKNPRSFSDVLLYGLGKTICTHFYFPYAEKLWGFSPGELSAVQAQRRVSTNNIGKMIMKVLSVIPVFRKKGAGRFFYPRKGFIQLFDKFAEKIKEKGGQILLSHELKSIDPAGKVIITKNDITIPYDLAFSTIPIPDLVNALTEKKPDFLVEACKEVKYRGMLFCYLILNTQQFTRYDAHYFPEKGIVFSRLSEPKNYSASGIPEGLTGLCAEIPCKVGGKLWNTKPEEIAGLVIHGLRQVGLPVDGLVKESFIRRTAHAYPSYDLEFEKRIQVIEDYLKTIPDIIPLGRQALFVHDNTHHTIEMGLCAADCILPDGGWDKEKWNGYREMFKTHVVED
ncbi:MAG: FAD-dependent oxidoreductase [Spirochaetales bacterium]|nr:FAD-dependent oxidoreductase [Spirochaetales bacterium]